jgi:hypothetical protein
MQEKSIKETSISQLEHQYILAALNGLCAGAGIVVLTKQMQAGDICGLAIGMGRATYKSVTEGVQIPTSSIIAAGGAITS